MQRITTGDLAKAIQPFFPIATDDMVRGWVEAGYLLSMRNPISRGWHYIHPHGIEPFLRGTLEFTGDQVREVLGSLGARAAS